MPKLDELKKELHELRENTLNEYKEFEAVDFDSEKKEEWAKRNEKMAELVTQVKEATKIEAERKAMEDELEAGKAVEPKAIHTEAVEAEESYKKVQTSSTVASPSSIFFILKRMSSVLSSNTGTLNSIFEQCILNGVKNPTSHLVDVVSVELDQGKKTSDVPKLTLKLCVNTR